MKIILSLLGILLLGCTTPETKIPTGILSEAEFANMLKDVHLAESAFELNKREGIENAKNALANSYQTIYKRYDITDTTFSKSLDYYAKNPEKLKKTYTDILKQLTDERSTLDHSETN